MTSDITRNQVEEGFVLAEEPGVRKIFIVQRVVPSDKSPTLPTGEYLVAPDVQWIGHGQEKGIATFRIVKGSYASEKRRIGLAIYPLE